MVIARGGYGCGIAGYSQAVIATAPRTATTAGPHARPGLSQAMRTARALQAIALLVILLAVAAADRVFGLGLACLGLGAAAGAITWRALHPA